MQNTKLLLKNTTVLLFGNLLQKFLVVFLAIYTARKLGIENLGFYAIATSIINIFTILTDLGLNSLLIREIAQKKNETANYFWNILVFKVGIYCVLFIGLIIITKLLNYNPIVEKTIYLLSGSVFFSVLFSLGTSLFQAHEKMEYTALVGVIQGVLLTVIGGLVLYFGYGVVELGWVTLVSSFLTFLVTVIIIKKKFNINLTIIDYSLIRKLIEKAIPFAVLSVLIALYYRNDMLLLSKLPILGMKNEIAVGYYSASYKIIDTLQIIPGIVITAVFPLFSRLYMDNKNVLFAAYNRIIKYLVIIAVPLAVGTTILAFPIINLIYGSQYDLSGYALRILIWAIGIGFVNSLFSTMLTSIGKMKILIIVSGINLFINLTLNLILIPSWGLNLGFIGAGISTLITEFISFGIVYIYYNKYINRINIFWGFHKILISTFVMSILILNINCNLLVRIVLGIVIYGICIYISRIFDSEDGKVFSSIFSYIRIKHT